MSTTATRGYFTVKAAAEYISTSEKTVRRLISSGKLKAVYFSPRTLRIPVAALDALAESNATVGGAV